MVQDKRLLRLLDILRDVLTRASILSQTYFVGGAVRDMLCGKAVKDIDITIAIDPHPVAREFADLIKGAYVPLTMKYMTARVVKSGYVFDFTKTHGDLRNDDLPRRDFTINALAIPMSHMRGDVIDATNGINDLSSRLIRMLSKDNLKSDPVRLLRAFRFKATLDFTIDPETLAAIEDLKAMIKEPSTERVSAELRILFSTNNAYNALRQMIDTGLYYEMFPELAGYFTDREAVAFNLRIFRHIELISKNTRRFFHEKGIERYLTANAYHKPCLKFAAMMQRVSLDGGALKFDPVDETVIRRMFRRLHTAVREMNYVVNVGRHISLLNTADLSRRNMVRLLMKTHENIYGLILLYLSCIRALNDIGHKIDERDFIGYASQIMEFYNAEFLPRSAVPRFITGKDINEIFGLPPSKLFSTVINMIEVKRLDGSIGSREEAITEVERFLAVYQ